MQGSVMFKIKLVTPQIHTRSGERRESDTIEPGYGTDNKPQSRFFFLTFFFLESSILSGFKIKRSSAYGSSKRVLWD